MTLLRATLAFLALSAHVAAFAPSLSRAARTKVATTTPRHMADNDNDKEEPTLMKSVLKKQIAYDSSSGRFFETNIEEQDCVPDEEFCMTDSSSGEIIRLTQEEKERIFLDSLQAYYSSGRKVLSDEEFDLLKEDLTWSGSAMVIMNRKEAQYLAAMQDYLKGNPSMGDVEFDTLKKELLEEGSAFAVQTEPQCYIDTGVCKVTLVEDSFKRNLLYLPAGLSIFVVWLGFSYELIEPLARVNPIFLALAGTPFIYSGSRFLTEELLFPDFKVARGPCPSCNYDNNVFFGNILGVEGFSDLATVKCRNCKEQFSVQRNTLRASTVPKA